MTSLWSKTKTAVSNGYGMTSYGRIGLPNPFYKPKPWGIHPELLEEPPYAQKEENSTPRLHRMKTRGGSLIKGSAEAKARMAYLRSLRGNGRGGGKKRKMLKGGDMSSFIGPLLESIGGTAANAIKRLALDTGASITQLLSDPKSLIQNLMLFAPAAARAVKNFFTGRKNEENDPKQKKASERMKYLRLLKKYNPGAYRREMLKLKQQKQQKSRKRQKYYDFDEDDDDYLNNDNEDINKPVRRKPVIDNFDDDNDVNDFDDVDYDVMSKYKPPKKSQKIYDTVIHSG